MSVELRITTEGECTCGVVYSAPDPPPHHDHHVECCWGRIDYPDPRPDLDQVGHLMLTSAGYISELRYSGPRTHPLRDGRIDSVTVDQTTNPHRLFVHSEHKGRRWTWELFDAHWNDGNHNGHRWLIGRWPD